MYPNDSQHYLLKLHWKLIWLKLIYCLAHYLYHKYSKIVCVAFLGKGFLSFNYLTIVAMIGRLDFSPEKTEYFVKSEEHEQCLCKLGKGYRICVNASPLSTLSTLRSFSSCCSGLVTAVSSRGRESTPQLFVKENYVAIPNQNLSIR